MTLLRGLVAVLLLCALGAARAEEPPLRATQLADRVWFVEGQAALGSPANRNFISNAGFVVTDDGVVGEAARNLEPFDDAYAKADWSRYEHLPLFRAANRVNACNTYLLMEQQGGK